MADDSVSRKLAKFFKVSNSKKKKKRKGNRSISISRFGGKDREGKERIQNMKRKSYTKTKKI